MAEPDKETKSAWFNRQAAGRWGTIAAVLTAIVLVGNFIKAGDAIEPYFPASRGYVRDAIEDAKVVNAQKLLETQIALRLAVDRTERNQLEDRIERLKAEISQSKVQKLQIEALLAEKPGDPTLRRTIVDLGSVIDAAQENRLTLQCRLAVLNGDSQRQC